jgi:hypothetical protein
MDKCTPNSKDLESHLFPSLIPFLGNEYFMCRELMMGIRGKHGAGQFFMYFARRFSLSQLMRVISYS